MTPEDPDQAWKDYLDMDHDDLPDKEVTSMVRMALRRRFDAPEWILAYEYPSPEGKRADAIAYNTYPSRNYKIVGFEIKASRSDWRNEMKDGAKADYFVQVCDEWYVVAGRRGIVDEKELPAGWGLMELKPNSGQLWKLEESDLTEIQNGREPDRRFFTKFMRTAVGDEANFTRADLRQARREGYAEGQEDAVQGDLDYDTRKMKEKAEKWDELLESGFDFMKYRDPSEEADRLRRARQLVWAMEGHGRGNIVNSLDNLERTAERLRDDRIEHLLESIDEAREQVDDLAAMITDPEGDSE